MMSEQPPLKCEVQCWRTRTNEHGKTIRKLYNEGAETEDSSDGQNHALVMNKIFNKQDVLTSTTLEVNSPHILEVFRNRVGSHFSVPSNFEASTTLESPFLMLVHHWNDLQDHLCVIEDDEARMHLSLFLRWMDTELGELKRQLDTEHQSGFCNFSTCWALFKPEDVMIAFDKSHPRLLKAIKTVYEENQTSGKYIEVHHQYTDHDGIHAGAVTDIVRIYQKEYFGQENPAIITELPIYPRSYYKVGSELEDMLHRRGIRFLELSKEISVGRYDGLALYAKFPPPEFFDPAADADEDLKRWKTYTETGRVVVDQKTYRQEHKAAEVHSKNHLADDDIAMCPTYIYGYSCHLKNWCKFFLDNVRNPQWVAEPFDDLMLPSDAKELLQALVTSHHFPEQARDQTLQKGKGLVCLLYGPPGTGKTMTAERAAELTQRALLSCSLSELNQYDNPCDFEVQLSKLLFLATTWKAIVLLDEADVFLEARQDGTSSSVERNALVAVFLKQLEYFSGIVFLTTNRINVFDAAMKSRVHLALEYQKPGQDARRALWRNQVTKVADGPSGDSLEALLDWAQELKQLNGREIANAVMTASTLARYKSEPLQLEHLKIICRVQKNFTDDLKHRRMSTVLAEPSIRRTNSIISEEPDEY